MGAGVGQRAVEQARYRGRWRAEGRPDAAVIKAVFPCAVGVIDGGDGNGIERRAINVGNAAVGDQVGDRRAANAGCQRIFKHGGTAVRPGTEHRRIVDASHRDRGAAAGRAGAVGEHPIHWYAGAERGFADVLVGNAAQHIEHQGACGCCGAAGEIERQRAAAVGEGGKGQAAHLQIAAGDGKAGAAGAETEAVFAAGAAIAGEREAGAGVVAETVVKRVVVGIDNGDIAVQHHGGGVFGDGGRGVEAVGTGGEGGGVKRAVGVIAHEVEVVATSVLRIGRHRDLAIGLQGDGGAPGSGSGARIKAVGAIGAEAGIEHPGTGEACDGKLFARALPASHQNAVVALHCQRGHVMRAGPGVAGNTAGAEGGIDNTCHGKAHHIELAVAVKAHHNLAI